MIKRLVFFLILSLLLLSFYYTQPAYSTQACVQSTISNSMDNHSPSAIVHEKPTVLPNAIAVAPTRASIHEEEITLLFSGQMVPGRCVQAGVDKYGNADYIYSAIQAEVKKADLAITTINGSLTDFCPAMGCVTWTFILNGTPNHAEAMASAGFDAVSVATNHINNCSLTNVGFRPLLETLEHLKKAGLTPIGAGKNLEEALEPQIFNIKGVRFAIISLGEIEKNVFAKEKTPGIAVLNEENLTRSLQKARELGDVIIFMPHWGPEYSPYPNPNQLKYARLAVKHGTDLIIGNHTHVIQGYEKINNVPVYYGLGNFVFDQFWELPLRSSLLLKVKFMGKKLISTEYDILVSARDGTLTYAEEEQKQAILNIINKVNQQIEKNSLRLTPNPAP